MKDVEFDGVGPEGKVVPGFIYALSIGERPERVELFCRDHGFDLCACDAIAAFAGERAGVAVVADADRSGAGCEVALAHACVADALKIRCGRDKELAFDFKILAHGLMMLRNRVLNQVAPLEDGRLEIGCFALAFVFLWREH